MRNTADPYDTTTELYPNNILPFKENYEHVNMFRKMFREKKERKKVINTNKYEQTMSGNSQHRVPYYPLISSLKGPVFSVV